MYVDVPYFSLFISLLGSRELQGHKVHCALSFLPGV